LSRGKEKTSHKDKENSPEINQQSEQILETKLSKSNNMTAPNILQPQTEGEHMPDSSSVRGHPDLLSRNTSKTSGWYWITIALTIASAIAVLVIGEVGPLAYIRYISASILVLFLPGYAFLRVLSPSNAQNSGKTNHMDSITRLALSVVLSIAIVSVLGFVLDFSPFGVTLDSLVLSLSLFTLFLSTVALSRERRHTQVGENKIG
jgi:hypothetical protein